MNIGNELKDIYDKYSFCSNINFDSFKLDETIPHIEKNQVTIVKDLPPNVKQINLYLKNKKEKNYFTAKKKKI